MRSRRRSRQSSSAPPLEVKNLRVLYDNVALALSGVTLSVPERSVVALLGPNGSGKTTALRAITGLLPVHDGAIVDGTVKLFGEDVTGQRPHRIVRRGLAQVMEGRRIVAHLTVEENLRAGASLSRRRVGGLLDRLYQRFPILAERRHRAGGYLSGGEQQILAIARALAARPRLLLLDEPSLGLAPVMVAQIARLIAEIRDEGISVLLVEQNAAVALRLADHAYILENGRIALDGPADQLRRDRHVRDVYLGLGEGGERSFRDAARPRPRTRWLS